MTEVMFYHLERGRLEDVLPGLLEKTLERGWRAVVRASSRERVEALDNFLWTYRDESFLPHGAAGDGESHPVWLTHGEDAPNSPDILFLTDNAAAAADSIGAYTRCVTIFDGRDEDALGAARAFWKEAQGAGHEVAYWKQSPEGRWEKQN